MTCHFCKHHTNADHSAYQEKPNKRPGLDLDLDVLVLRLKHEGVNNKVASEGGHLDQRAERDYESMLQGQPGVAGQLCHT